MTGIKGSNTVVYALSYQSRIQQEDKIVTLPHSHPAVLSLRFAGSLSRNKGLHFTKKEIIEALGMSKRTFYKYFLDLKELE
ncbi:MAG TPA: TetR/AcrR family transcriptional regulator [Candidatus Korarchaeota archaeon]|nr:TetR/AcrR family transcriptional regulator [Candidatus Korarchaeota archaeon]